MESTILRIELGRIESEKQILESKILEFYNHLTNIDGEYYGFSADITDKYKEHFNIQIDEQGYIEYGN